MTLAASIAYAATEYLDSPFHAWTLTCGVGATRDIGDDLTLGIDIAYAKGSLISGDGALTKDGAATLTLTGANTYTGDTIVNDGSLALSGTGSLWSSGKVVLAGGSTFDISSTSGDATIGSLAGGSGTVALGARTLTLSDNTSTTFSGDLTGTGGIVKQGTGAFTLAGTNTYTGTTTIGDQCQLNYSTSSALGDTSSGTVIQANGRLGVTSFVGSLTNAEPITVNGLGVTAAPGALYVNTPNNNVTYSGPITIASDARFRVVNTAARMNFANTVLGTDVALWCTAGNAAADTATTMSFLNTFSIGNGMLTKDGQGIVAFESQTTPAAVSSSMAEPSRQTVC